MPLTEDQKNEIRYGMNKELRAAFKMALVAKSTAQLEKMHEEFDAQNKAATTNKDKVVTAQKCTMVYAQIKHNAHKQKK